MKNKDKNHISDIALGEFATAFAFVVFSMIFSSASAQTSAPIIPNLPVNGQVSYQVPRADANVTSRMNELMQNGYSLGSNLSWNPIDNMQTAYNYARWNLIGNYNENINGDNYNISRLDDGIRAQATNSAGTTTTAEMYSGGAVDSSVARMYPDGSRDQFASLSGGGTFQSFQPAQGDSFVRNQGSDGKSTISTIDSETKVAKIQDFDSEGKQIAEKYTYPPEKMGDGNTRQLTETPSLVGNGLFDKEYNFTTPNGEHGTSTIANLAGGGAKVEYDYPNERTTEYFDQSGKLENTIDHNKLWESDPTTEDQGGSGDWDSDPGYDRGLASNNPPQSIEDIEKLASKVAYSIPSSEASDSQTANSENSPQNNTPAPVDYNNLAKQNSLEIAKENGYQAPESNQSSSDGNQLALGNASSSAKQEEEAEEEEVAPQGTSQAPVDPNQQPAEENIQPVANENQQAAGDLGNQSANNNGGNWSDSSWESLPSPENISFDNPPQGFSESSYDFGSYDNGGGYGGSNYDYGNYDSGGNDGTSGASSGGDYNNGSSGSNYDYGNYDSGE